MSKKIIFILLSSIILLAVLLRFVGLSHFPNGFHRDEAFFGYNAYSLLKTGKDITGNFLPLHLASFLYTPSGYAYISIPFIALFGLSEFSIRAGSAFFGSLTVLMTYFLSLELFSFLKRKQAEIMGLVSAFLLAISPWHINLSRTASAIAVVVFFITLGIWMYLLSLRKRNWKFIGGAFISWFVSLQFYIAPYSFLPLFIPLLFGIFRRESFFSKTKVIQVSLFFLLILMPLLWTLLSPKLSLRANSLSITKWEGIQTIAIEQIHADGPDHIPLLITRLFHNKFFLLSQAVIGNYFHHFSFDFLFTDSGFPDRYRVPLVGLVYLYELPLLLLGFITLLHWKNKIGCLLIGWILLAPVGSSLTYDDVPNLQRTLLMLPALTIVAAVGLVTVIQYLSGIKRKIGIGVISFIVILSLSFYLHQYYFHATVYRPWYRMEGYKTLVAKVVSMQQNYTNVVVTNRESAPTIFFLFFLKYNPSRFQIETAHTTMTDFDRIGFGKYTFSQEECPLQEKTTTEGQAILTGQKGVLYVDSGLCEIPKKARILSTIYRSDNSKVFVILDLP